jgi:organic hydroperoxide reductase OsmC/OhrA
MWAAIELILLASVYAAGCYHGAQNAINSQNAINAPKAINAAKGLGVGP